MSGTDTSQKTIDLIKLEEKIDKLVTSLDQQLPEIINDMEKSAENNIKFVNLIKENARIQNDNMNYLEKKLEFIDKTIELKSKHFDETLKSNTENNDNLVKMVQANLHSQDNVLNSIENSLNSMKYWLIITIVAIGGLVWGTNSHFQNKQQTGAGYLAGDTSMQPGILASINDNKRLINNIQKDNKDILTIIQKDNKDFFAKQEKLTADQLKTLQKNTQTFITKMQNENRELLTAIQQTNQEYLTTIINTLRSDQAKFTPPPPVKLPRASSSENKSKPTPTTAIPADEIIEDEFTELEEFLMDEEVQ